MDNKPQNAYESMKTQIHQDVQAIGVPVQRLHHFANYCRDAEETRHFYEDLLGMKLVHVLRVDYLPSSKIYSPYVHLFFEMKDGSSLAFFDLLDPPTHPGMTSEQPWTNHIALKLDHMDELFQAKQKLEEAGVRVIGPIDHEFTQSIYFKDPNGVNLELAVNSADEAYMQHEADTAHQNLKQWTEEKRSHLTQEK